MDLRGTILKYKYKISELLSESRFAFVYGAFNRLENNKRVVIKFLKKDGITKRREDVVRFRNEEARMAMINHRNIVKLIEFGINDDLNYIVMEPAEGKCLSDMVDYLHGLSIDKKTDIIMQMSDALVSVHGQGIVHRAVNPGNIFVHDEGTGPQCKLVNYAIANIRDFSKITGKNDILKTFSYMSPEQSGIMRRKVDNRSDLYSLGIIFYELLTHRLPFEGTDINSIIHRHIAMLPDPPRDINPEIPVYLEKIIWKLLEKEPEKRYQTANSLFDDLKKYFSGEIHSLPGIDDEIITFHRSEELIGRDDEYKILVDELGVALNGSGRLCLISGEPGIGKTRLVEELGQRIYYHEGTFITCNCTEGGNVIPYEPIRDILNTFLKNYQQYSFEKKKDICLKLNKGLGPLSEVLVTLHPLMSEIFDRVPSSEITRPDRQMQRFLLAVSRFFYELSVAENGIVIILDNLQWMDEGSFQVMREIMKHIAEYPLFIIGLYRNSKESEAPDLQKFMDYTKISGYPFREIQMMPFSEITMNEFLSVMLHRQVEDIAEVSSFIMANSRGSPFVAMEILKQLIDENAITRQAKKLILRSDIINRIQILNTSISIIRKRISLLNETETQIVSYACVIGVKFEMEMLLKITKYGDIDVISAIDRAISLQLIQNDIDREGSYVFIDAAICEVLYQKIPEEKQKVIHQTIASLLETIQNGDTDYQLFDIAHHYIASGNREKILEYAYPAGIRAMESYANEEALVYLEIVRKIYEDRGMEGGEVWIECMKKIGSIYLRNGKSIISTLIFSVVLEYCDENNDKAYIYNQIGQGYFITGDWKKCEFYCDKGLRLMGEKIPVSRFAVIARFTQEIIYYYAALLFYRKFSVHNNDAGIEKYRTIIHLYMTLDWMYILSDNMKFLWSVMRMVNISRKRLGVSRELGMSLAFFATVLMVIPLSKKSLKYNEIALKMRQGLGDLFGIAQSMQFIGYALLARGDYISSIRYFLESEITFTKLGDLWEIAMVKNGLGYDYFYLGNFDEAISSFMEYLDISEKIYDNYGISVSTANLSLCYLQTGELDKAKNYIQRALTLSKENELWYPFCFASINHGMLQMENEEYDEALQSFETARQLLMKNSFLHDFTVYLFPCLAEAYIRLYQASHSKKMKKNIRKACMESLSRTRYWPNHYAAALRVTAKYYALIGKSKKANAFFKKSIKHSAMTVRKFEMGMGLYEYGLHLRKTDKTDEGDTRLNAAHQVFNEIKSALYVEKIEALLDMTQEDFSSSMSTMIDRRRMYSIFQISQDISSIMNLEALLEKIMMAAIELMGAQRGALYLVNDDTGILEIEVNKHIDILQHNKTGYFMNMITQEVFTSGKPVLVMNAMEDEKYSKYSMVARSGLKSIMCVPLIHQDEVRGVCYLDNPLSDSVFTEEDQDVLIIIMTQAAISIENVRLYELGITDGMTKLVTHAHFQNLLKKEISKASRFRRDLSIVMFDIDHFKIFNDTYGHQAGDEVLKIVSGIIKSSCREIDTAVRYGGEELMLMLPETSVEEAAVIAERTSKAIQDHPFIYQDTSLSVTVSTGVAAFPLHATDGMSLIKAADVALYWSKNNGRNTVTVYSDAIGNTQSGG